MHLRTIVIIAAVACAVPALAGCTSGDGDICFVDSDCGSGLYCCTTPPSRGRCFPDGEECMVISRVDGGPGVDGGPRVDGGPPPDSGMACEVMLLEDGGVDDTCSMTEFCRVESCGAFGECETRRLDCPGLNDPQCGCDGLEYLNECEANSARVSVRNAGPCEPVPDGGPGDGGPPDSGAPDGGDADGG